MRRWRGRTASGPSRNEGQRDVVVRCRRRPHEVTNLSALAEQRQAKDDFFARHPQSPLTAAQRREFKGLRYYAENEALRLRLPLERGEQAERIIMDTSTGDRRVYLRAGTARFEGEGEEGEVALYAVAGRRASLQGGRDGALRGGGSGGGAGTLRRGGRRRARVLRAVSRCYVGQRDVRGGPVPGGGAGAGWHGADRFQRRVQPVLCL